MKCGQMVILLMHRIYPRVQGVQCDQFYAVCPSATVSQVTARA